MKKESVDLGFTASRTQRAAYASPHPNTCHFLMEVTQDPNGFKIYIETECGNGEKILPTAQAVNEEIAKVKETFVKEGHWRIKSRGFLSL